MKNSQKAIYYISSICWSETSEDEIINNNALQTNEYIEVSKSLNEDEAIKFIDHKLYESSGVHPWYYNVDVIC